MEPTTLMVNNVKYIREDSVPKAAFPFGPIQIVVVDKGFVYVGVVEIDPTGLTLRKAMNIRYWGTTKGLGELVNGPTKNTKLDQVGTIRIPNHAVISVINVDQNTWKL